MAWLLCFAARLLNEKDMLTSKRTKARVAKEETRDEAILHCEFMVMSLFV